MGGHRRVLPFVLCALVGVAGCGGSSPDAGKIQAGFAAFVRDVRQHDAAGACAQITPAFWSAMASEWNGQLVNAGRPSLPRSNCRAGLQSMFGLAGHTPLIPSNLSATDVAVDGTTATAREGGRGGLTVPMRFVKAGGQWRLDCCTGPQLERQPQTTYRVPSQSMMPTLHTGQIVVSDNVALREHPPALGAIVVFHAPAGADAADPQCGVPGEGVGSEQACGRPTPGESSQTFIKRVVGLPGDRIAIVNGTVIRNGKPEPRTYKVVPCNGGVGCNFPTAIVVPPDEYFVLGDNLPDSSDSRYWGPVKRSWLIGLIVRVSG